MRRLYEKSRGLMSSRPGSTPAWRSGSGARGTSVWTWGMSYSNGVGTESLIWMYFVSCCQKVTNTRAFVERRSGEVGSAALQLQRIPPRPSIALCRLLRVVLELLHALCHRSLIGADVLTLDRFSRVNRETYFLTMKNTCSPAEWSFIHSQRPESTCLRVP